MFILFSFYIRIRKGGIYSGYNSINQHKFWWGARRVTQETRHPLVNRTTR